MNKKIIYIGCLLGLLLSSCIETKKFNMDESLLEDAINDNDLQISYRMPAGFKPLVKSRVDSIAQMELQNDPFSNRIRAIYVDTLLLNANAMVSDMRHVPAERTENQLDFYFTSFNPQHVWNQIDKQTYKFNDFSKVVQLDMYNDNRRLIKLFFYQAEKPTFCVDYFMPESFYANLKPFIESSIASFKIGYTLVIETEQP